jgi:DNA-binding SARP family transcriptional activator
MPRGSLSVRVDLLGSPRLERDGVPLPPPRGNKTWGLLTYLVCTRVPSSRARIADLLFPEADDPLGALRWTMSDLRRLLGGRADLGGEPVRLALPRGAFVDVDVLNGRSWAEAVALPAIGRELLEGLAFPSSPGFEIWLDNERRHVAGLTAAVLRQAALALLAYGDPVAAASRASQLVQLDRFDENAHALLVRCLRAAGDDDAAAGQILACEEIFRRELGLEPSAAVRDAGLEPRVRPSGVSTKRASVLARIETGEAIVAAGATEAGLEKLRGACASARVAGEPDLLARSLIALGATLVHGARGTDEEGAAALHEGVRLAERAGETKLAATGLREIGWVQFLRAEYERAAESLARTAALAGADEEELAWVDVILGSCKNDVGEYAAARTHLESAVDRSRRLTPSQLLAFGLTMLARLHLALGDVEPAEELLDEALAVVEARGLTAFRPWPESFRAEIDLVHGDVVTAERRFQHAFAVGCEVGDPCWESIAMRGLGLVALRRGDVSRALELLIEAPRRCRRLPDTYLWIEAYGLDSLCSVAIEQGMESAPVWIGELESITSRRGMRELLLRATLYRARLGEPGALDAARSLASQIDNPELSAVLDVAAPAAVVA